MKFNIRLLLLLLPLVITINKVLAQKQLLIGFYNQENLFDTIDDPRKNDNEFLPDGKNKWNTEKYLNKLSNMAKVIASLKDSKGADVLGMCEVENAAVLADLIKQPSLQKQQYGFVHIEGPDLRSIDNALLYKKKQLTLVQSSAYPILFENAPSAKTRDILLVKLFSKDSKSNFVVLVNHFPSRVGGAAESEPKRIAAAKVLRRIYDSIVKADPNIPIIVMGDFNDEPTDISIAVALNAKGTLENLASHDLFNSMYSFKEKKLGSHFYRNEWTALDQIILSSNLVNCTEKLCYKAHSAAIYKQDWMLEQEGKYKGAPLRTFGGQTYLNGFSDHLPVYIVLEVRK